jgi:outer membrane protein assembly factor BamB
MEDDLPYWRWQTRPSAPDWAVAIPEDLAEALVSKIRFKSNKKSEIQQSFATWYASSKVVSERACSASLAVRLHSDGRVWVNDRLVWRSDRSVTPEVITSVPVDLVAGENRITVACSPFRGHEKEQVLTIRYGRFGLGWFSLWIRAGVQTTSTVVTQDLRSIAPMKSTPANPPLAWDLRTGENVRWQINLPVEDAPPAVFQDRVFAALTTGELACLDRATGAVIWRQGPSIAAMAQPKPQTRMTDGSDGSTPEQVVIPPMTLAPVVDPQAVWLHDPERGRVACFGHDGRERWSVQVPPMTDRVQRGWFDGRTFDPRQTPVLADGRLYISSGPIEAPGNRRCWPRQGRVMALDAASGKVLWQRMDLRGHGLFARMLLDQNPDGTLLILDSNEVLNAATGVTLISRCAFPLDINMTPPAIAGDTAYIHGGGVAVRFQRDAEGRVGSQVLWSCPREQLARFYNFNTGGIQPVPAVLDEVLLMAKGNYDFHVAGPVADNFLYVFDRRSGVTVHRRCEYLLNGLNTAPALLVAGGRLYVADGGCRFKLAYTVSGESTAPRVAVFTAQDPPALLAICPGLSDVVPVADGPSLFLAGRGRLACIERPAEKRERLAPVELRNMALHFLNQEIPPTPQNATKPHILQPLARLPADIPLSLVTELMPGIFPPRILGAYPLPYDPAITDPSTKISGAVMGLPHLGSRLQFSVDQAIPFRLLDAENVRFNYSDKASTGNVFFPGSSYCLTANGLSSSPGLLQAAFFTVYYTPRLQTLSYRSSRGLRLWLSGKEIMNDDLLQLEPGYYPCFFTTRLRMPIKIMEKVRFLPCFQVEDNPAALWRTWANTVRKFRGHLETMVRDGAGLRESIGAQVILESLSIER